MKAGDARLPRHVAIIMDGNGRWAKQRGLPRVAGHHEGVHSVREIVEVAGELGLSELTLYTFSSENWRRPALEVNALMQLLLTTIGREVDRLDRNQVRLDLIGDLKALPDAPRKALVKAMEQTADNTGLRLTLALNYGGRQEILQAVNRLLHEGVSQIDEDGFGRYLYTAGRPDPDLLIRTGGEMRVSNFLLWQIAYTELYVSEALWPDFRREHLLTALESYANRERRFGQTSEQVSR